MSEALKVARRTVTGKNQVSKLRAEGHIPGVVYAKGKETVAVQISAPELVSYLEESGRIVDVDLSGEVLKALVKEVQHDIFTDEILHVDLQIVSMTEKVKMPVPVIAEGEASFQPEEGTLDQVLTEIEIECLPQDAPDALKVNVSEVKPGDSIHVRDLTVPPGVTVITSEDEVVVTVARPTVEEEEAPAEEGEEAQEPEVIKDRGKEEEEPAESE
jgi:large subunit ribosomal protein L25